VRVIEFHYGSGKLEASPQSEVDGLNKAVVRHVLGTMEPQTPDVDGSETHFISQGTTARPSGLPCLFPR